VPTTDFQVHDGLLVVQQTTEGKRLRVALQGEMDLANAECGGSVLREALSSGHSVVIDLAKLEFLDSTGVALLVEAIGSGGERLSFLPSEHGAVQRLLSLTGLEERMTFASPMALSATGAEDAGAESLLPAA